MSRYRYPLLVFLGGACYGILSTIVKLAYAAGIDRSGVSSGQFFFGLLLLLVPAWRARPRQLTARQVLVMLAAGVPTGGTTLFYYHALVSVSASLAVVLLFQYIVIALVLEAILRRAWPARQKLAALVLLQQQLSRTTGNRIALTDFLPGLFRGHGFHMSGRVS